MPENVVKALPCIDIKNVTVTGIEFDRLHDLSIHHEPNQHAQAVLFCDMEKEQAQKFIQQVDLKKVIKIEAVGDDDTKDKQVLFQGCIIRVQVEYIAIKASRVHIVLADTSILLDIKRESRTFQVLTQKYEEILKTIYKTDQDGKVLINVEDKPIENFTIRLEETGWEFTKRMASRFNAPILSDLTAEKPVVSFGLRKENQEIKYTVPALLSSMSEIDFQFITNSDAVDDKIKSKFIREDASYCQLTTSEYLYLGDVVQVGSKKYYVQIVDTVVAGENLRHSYRLVTQQGFVVPRIPLISCRGRLMKGQVQKVEKDKVQVHFLELDDAYDTKSTTWFPFATVYSSSDGSGWYVMPEEKDYVRMMFPSGNEAEAYAASSINMVPTDKVKEKSLRAPGGREILLTEDTIEIICDHQKIFVNLSKKDGISIISSQDIKVSADGDISMESKGKIQLLAKEEIQLQSGSAHVKIKSNQIAMGGSSVLVGE